jgi:CDP-glucose 4,6-dehydratase
MNNFKGKNILVTGGTGFVGSHLVEELVRLDANVITTHISLNPRSYFSTRNLGKFVTMVNVDICNFESIFDVIAKFKIDYIFHLAAQPLVDVAYHNPRRTLESNIMGTVNILESCRLYKNIRGVVVASSDKAYGKLQKDKYFESDALKGDHPYEVSKSAADLICNTYFKTYDVPVIITRFGNIYGEGDLNFSRIVPGIIRSLFSKNTLEIRSNGKYVRDYLYVKDVVSAYLLLASNIEKAKGEAYNFGSEETLSVIEVIRRIEKSMNKKVNYKILNNAVNEIPYQSLDYSKIKKAFAWKAKNNFASTIKKIYSWYSKMLS